MKQTIPKKLASGVAAAAMTLSLLPAAALAADSEYSASGATGFAFTDSGIAAEDGSYTGYKISGTDLTIQDSGTYIVSGNCSDGSITIKACYEGLEAATLNILSGNISILSEDDCLNAANSDLTGYSFSMTISGGAITAYSSTGDGFDSNGDLTITGGTVVVWTANTADDQPLDADGTLTVSGGTVLAAGGSAGMGVPISAAQPYVTFGSTGAMGGGQMGGSGAPSTLPGGTNGQQPPAQPDGSDSSNGSSAPQPVQSSGFTDVAASDWFYSAVLRYAYENGLMTGTGSGAFSPNATITRGMLVTILYRLKDEPAVTAANPFTDVSSGSYCEKAAAWAAANGIVGGYGDGRFGPNDALTREQLAAILYRYAQYKGYDLSASADPSGYSDQAGISAFARTAMAWANAEGLITGTSGSLLSPKGTATRAQTAMILMRFCQKV